MKPGNVYDMSATSQRRIIKQVEETIIENFNCDQTQALQIAQMYSARSTLNVTTPSFNNRKRTNENPASNSSAHESSPSHLKITSVEKYQRKYATFTDDEKIGIVEAFVDCENLSEKRIALTHQKKMKQWRVGRGKRATNRKVVKRKKVLHQPRMYWLMWVKARVHVKLRRTQHIKSDT
jgi:hypothetical protein